MSIANITNGESGSSVRGKLNSVIEGFNPFNIIPESEIIAWDDFSNPSLDIAGRVAPKGGTWACFLADGTPTTGLGSVNNSSLRVTTGMLNTFTGISVASLNGCLFKGLSRRDGGGATGFSILIKGVGNEYVQVDSGAELRINKVISEVVTVLKTVSDVNYDQGSTNAKSIFPFEVSLINLGASWTIAASFGAFGISIRTTDADVLSILNNPTYIGIGGFRGYGAYGVQLIKIP